MALRFSLVLVLCSAEDAGASIQYDPLCDCVSITTTSISESSFEQHHADDILCYSYSIQYHLAIPTCQTPRVDLLFASCGNDDGEQLLQSMHAIYLNEQSQSVASSVTDAGVAINNLMPSFNADLLTFCMKNTHKNGGGDTSHAVTLIFDNNDIISCANHASLPGLPCTHIDGDDDDDESIALVGQQQTVAADISDDDDDDDETADEPLVMTHSLYEKKKDETVFEILPLSQDTDIAHKLELDADVMSDSGGVSVSSHTHAISENIRLCIKFAFVTIMIFIAFNVLFCIFLSLRHSGALDKYFEQVPDEEDEDDYDVNEFLSDDDDEYEEDGVQLERIRIATDRRVDLDADIDDEDDINDEQALFDCVSASRALEPGSADYEAEEQKKLRIYITELQNDPSQSDHDVNTPFKE